MTTVNVNGRNMTLDWSVGWLDYYRVVKIASLPPSPTGRYRVHYKPNGDHVWWTDIGSGVLPLEGMLFRVEADSVGKPWWRWLWPE